MKRSVLASILILIAGSSAYAAGNQHSDITMAFGPPVTIHNDTANDVAYTISSNATYNDNIYGIRVGRADVYHVGTGDTRATIYVGNCSALPGNGLICHKIEGRSLINCVNYAHYDMNQVDTIHINALNACTVTCSDGGTTSCVAH